MYMDIFKKTLILFLLGCIPLRILFVVIAKMVNVKYLFYLGILALFPAFNFLFLHFYSSYRTKGVFGQTAWWNRLVHGLLYLAFAVFAILGNRNAYLFLLIDVIYGFSAFTYHHWTNGNFNKLIAKM